MVNARGSQTLDSSVSPSRPLLEVVNHDAAIAEMAADLRRRVRAIKAVRFVCTRCGWLWAKVPACDSDGDGIGDGCDKCGITSARMLPARPVGPKSARYWDWWINDLAGALYWCRDGSTPWMVENINKSLVLREGPTSEPSVLPPREKSNGE